MSPDPARDARFGPPRGAAEAAAYAAIVHEAFDVAPDDARAWLERAGLDEARVLVAGEEVLAGLLRVPMAQWFGGRAVPMVGVAAVGVPPEHRGRGAARRLMDAALAEMHAQGVPLSTLYPATTVLYRKGGYEVAGGRYQVTVPSGSLRGVTAPAGTTLRRLGPSDEATVVALAREEGCATPGQLERGPYIWRRVREPRAGRSFGYLVLADGRPEGHAYLSHRDVTRDGRHDYDVLVLDLSARSVRAADALLALFAGHAGIGREIVMHVHPSHPLVTRLPERHEAVRLVDPWMLRVVHVPAALAARGYPVSAQGELLLEVEDEVLPGNAGRHLLRVADGTGRVEPAPADARAAGGALRVHARGLAALYSGHQAPDALAVAGLLDGPPAARALAAALFAGPAPAMTDMF